MKAGFGCRDWCGSHLAVSVQSRCRLALLGSVQPHHSFPPTDPRLSVVWAVTGGPRRHLGPERIVELQAEQLRTCLTEENLDLHMAHCPVGEFSPQHLILPSLPVTAHQHQRATEPGLSAVWLVFFFMRL